MIQDLETAYAGGLSFEEYCGRVRVHAQAFLDHYNRLAFVGEQAGVSPLGESYILVLTEDYCIDSVLNLPLIARLAEASPKARLRIAKRDSHPDLAAAFPGRGGESRLPTVIFLSNSGAALGHWSERSRRDQAWMEVFLARDPIPDIVLEDGRPTPTLAAWMARRLTLQQPFFLAESWRVVRDELRATAQAG